MKGVLKGFKYISSIFEEEEEEEEDKDEIQIGLPTDVKHVAHVGTDGPSKESPSWLKDFTPERPKSAPLDSNGKPLDSAAKVSTDTELQRTSRRRHSADSLAFDNSDKVLSKTKGLRRHHKKNSDGSVGKSSRPRRHHKKESSSDAEGSSRSRSASNADITESSSQLPDIPKKSRRKKVTDEINKIATKARPKIGGDGAGADVPPSPAPLPPTAPTTTTTTTTTDTTSGPFSDPGSVGTDSTTTITCDGESCRISTKPKPPIVEEEKGDKRDAVGVP